MIPAAVISTIVISALAFGLYRKANPATFLLTLFIVCSPVPVLAYTRIDLIEEYFLALLLGVVLWLTCLARSHYYSFSRFRIVSFQLKSIILILVALLLAAFASFSSSPGTWLYEGHDVLYYGWINEVFKNDYSGPIRVSTAFPYELSANHLMAASILLPFQSFYQSINIQTSYSIKYFLTFSILSYFFYKYLVVVRFISASVTPMPKSRGLQASLGYISRALVAIATPLLVVYLYCWPEYDYNNSISSYSSQLLLLGISAHLFSSIVRWLHDRKAPNMTLISIDKAASYEKTVLASMIILFCFSKATLFPTALISVSLYISRRLFRHDAEQSSFSKRLRNLIKDARKLFGRSYVAAASVCLACLFSFVGWIIKRSQHGSIDLSFPFCIFTGNSPLKLCIGSVFRNPFENWDLLERHPAKSYAISSLGDNVATFIYIWILIIVPMYLISKYLVRHSEIPILRSFSICANYYSLGTAVSLVMIRSSSGMSGGHTSHSYLLGATLVALLALLAYLNLLFTKGPQLFASTLTYSLSLTALVAIFVLSPLETTFSVRKRLSEQEITDTTNVRPVISSQDSKLFDQKMCIKSGIQPPTPLLVSFMDQRGCATPPLQELLLAMSGKRGDATLKYSNSLVGQWTIVDH